MTETDIISSYTDDIVRQMFIVTADKNYTLARTAFFSDLMPDFYWLSFHAVEKYLKAILLLNDHAVKGYGHNLIRLHQAVLKRVPQFNLGNYVHPDLGLLQTFEGSLEGYLVLFLSEAGDPDSRYAVRGNHMGLCDLFVIDQIIWAIRRYCRRFPNEANVIEILKQDTGHWSLGGLHIERLLQKPSDDQRRIDFLHLNIPFAPDGNHTIQQWKSQSINSAIDRWYYFAGRGKRSEEARLASIEVLKWALQSIKLPEAKRKEIKAEIAIWDGHK